MTTIQNIAILGATGSIGASTLDVIARHPSRFRVAALTANRHVDELVELCKRHRPDYACVADTSQAPRLRERLAGAGANARGGGRAHGSGFAPEVDCVMAAIVRRRASAARGEDGQTAARKQGSAGVANGLHGDRAGGRTAAVDGEQRHLCAAVRHGELAARIRRILLTGSGPFRVRARGTAARPPIGASSSNWVMGRKISVDSATMMNKGLEIIEARWLFGASPEQIEVVIHPQSVVHSMVEYADGSVIAQLGHPDMRTPIAQALAYPERIEAGVSSLDLFRIGPLGFERPDFERFPALRLAHAALRSGGAAPATLNAANEVAVAAFLEGRLPFLQIAVIEETLAGSCESPARDPPADASRSGEPDRRD
jgi:1-deoxy-D-xylulose-5-phosphate reductoisomerase